MSVSFRKSVIKLSNKEMWKKQRKNAKNMRQKQSWDTDKTSKISIKMRNAEKHGVAWMVINILKICGWMRFLAWHAWNEAESFWEREWKIKTFWYGLQSNKKKTQGFVPSDSWKRKTVRFFCFGTMSHRAATQLPKRCLLLERGGRKVGGGKRYYYYYDDYYYDYYYY